MNTKLGKAYKLSRRMSFRGLSISIETDKGESRHWYDPHSGEKGSTMMTHPYGYIRRTEGTDGDHIDVYVGPNTNAKNVYIVNQRKKPSKKTDQTWRYFDEQKCMLGFKNAEDAKRAYLKNYDDERFFGSMLTLPFEEFKRKALETPKKPKRLLKLSSTANPVENTVNPHLKLAYAIGATEAVVTFEKNAGIDKIEPPKKEKGWFDTTVDAVSDTARKGYDKAEEGANAALRYIGLKDEKKEAFDLKTQIAKADAQHAAQRDLVEAKRIREDMQKNPQNYMLGPGGKRKDTA